MIGTIKQYVYDTCLAKRLELKIENPFDLVQQLLSICASTHIPRYSF